mgnify:CR=1 FL=1
MAIEILTNEEFEYMKASGEILKEVFRECRKFIVPGVTTHDIDKLAYDIIRSHDAIPSFLNYGEPPFPGSVCASINEEVVHGIPSSKRVLKDGDIISIDVGAILKGYHSDAARTFLVGNVDEETKLLVERTKEAFFVGLKEVKIGNRIGDVSNAVQQYAESFGYGVVRELTGHGIGSEMHQDPDVPNYGKPGRGPRIQKGMAFCLEPMITMKSRAVDMLRDEWTIVTVDGAPAAHYENTILITDGEPEILTLSM